MSTTASTDTPMRDVRALFFLVLVMSIPLYTISAFVPQEMVMFLALTLAPIPILAALILTCRAAGSTGAEQLLSRAFDCRRIKPKAWYLPIFLLLPALFLLALGITIFMGKPVPEPLFPLVAAPVAFLLFFPFALFEEVGWMGYAFEPMQARWTALKASIVLGLLWALWHIPFYYFAGLEPGWIVGQLFALVALRTLMAWLYSNTRKSVFGTILFHAVYNVCTLAFPSYYSPMGHALTSAFIVTSGVVIVFLWGPDTLARVSFEYENR